MASPLLPIETHDFTGVIEAKSASLLRELTRKSPQAGITSASHLEIRPSPETASSGIRQVDALTGGLPRGCLTEVSGADSSGRTSLMLSALAVATRREEICALIDVSDAFDPYSAAAAGVDLGRLLWVRCGAHAQASALSRRRRQPASLQEWERRRMEDPVEQALRATDLLLQSSGFGLVAIDLAGTAPKMARRIPLTTWFRFRRAVENTPAILLVIGVEPCTQSCASLALELSRQKTSRQSPVVSRQQDEFSSRLSVVSEEVSFDRDEEYFLYRGTESLSHAELLIGMESRAELLRIRTDRKPVQSANVFTTQTAWTA
jgi:hypothetical protein